MSGDRSPMSNEKLPTGASTALHQGRWSWRGGPLQANAKNCKPGNTSVRLGSLYGMKHINPPASGGTSVRDKENYRRKQGTGKDGNRGDQDV